MMTQARQSDFQISRRGSLLAPLAGSIGVVVLAFALLASPAIGSDSDQPASIAEHALRLAANHKRDEAERLLRAAVLRDPSDDSTYHALLNVSRSTDLTASSLSCESTQRKLPASFAQVQTSRFVLLSDADSFAVNSHGRWVERTCEEFERFARECDLRPLPLQHKLVCVLFQEHEEYQAFARHHDGMSNPAFTGYYSPRNDRVVFSLNTGAMKKPRDSRSSDRASGSPGKDVLGFESQPRGESGVKSHAGACDHSCDSNHDLASASAAKCVHETIHQLMFHTRIMSPDTQYPLWICEGLSTAFETNSPDAPFGPDYDFEPRRRVFHQLLERGELIQLRDLVTLTSLSGRDANDTRAVYHQGYALVTWLCRNHRDSLRNYLHAMRREPAGRLPASRHLELFEQAFGNVVDVERAWLDAEMASLNRRRDE